MPLAISWDENVRVAQTSGSNKAGAIRSCVSLSSCSLPPEQRATRGAPTTYAMPYALEIHTSQVPHTRCYFTTLYSLKRRAARSTLEPENPRSPLLGVPAMSIWIPVTI